MIVWMINHFALPPSRAGATRHYCLARELEGRGHRVVVICAAYDHLYGCKVSLGKNQRFLFQREGEVDFLWIRTPECSDSGLSRLRNMLAFSGSIRHGRWGHELQGPDVILGSSPHLFAASAARRWAARAGKPFVLEIRDLWPETLLELGGFRPWHPMILHLARIEKSLYRKADRIVTLLPASVEHMVKKGAPRDAISIVPNGVDLNLVPAPRMAARCPGPFRFIYAGAHGYANGLDLILDVASRLEKEGFGAHRVRFDLIGDGGEKKRLLKRVEDEAIASVRFRHPVPKNEIHGVLREADAFFMPLLESPLFETGISPNKLFDYMAAGRPVLFAVSSPVNPIIASGGGVTASPGDLPAMVSAVKKLVALAPEERWEMGRRGRAFVEQHHSFEELAKRLEAVLTDLAPDTGGDGR